MAEYKVPYQFIAGTRARAPQVNANFEYISEAVKNIDENKANLVGDEEINFFVAEPTVLNHAATKRYVDLAIANSGGGGSGVGKAMFEVFHTLSTKNPPGAFSLRDGVLLLDAENTYTSFWEALETQGLGLIPDFSNSEDVPSGYTVTFDNVAQIEGAASLEPRLTNRAFSPYSWLTVIGKPSASSPIVAQLEFPDVLKCQYFRINSHVVNTYDSIGDPDGKKAIKRAAISVRQNDGNWVPVAVIDEEAIPTSNDRYFKNEKPELEFNAMRIVIAENFGSSKTDVSLYPVNPESTTVRVVSEEQWQWEVAQYGETGAFVMDTEEKTVRLPKINRLLSGVLDMWEVGVPSTLPAGGSSLDYDDSDSALTVESSSMGIVSTGLWLQVYNAVSDEGLSNIKYVPHSYLFEERYFRFLPPEETGYYPCDGSWRDGTYFTDAMTLLMNQYAKAVSVSGKDYKKAPNGMLFVTDDVYESTYKTYGESPYYVLDVKNSRFKTPRSNNYIRGTHTLDNTGTLLLDAAPNIKGTYNNVGIEPGYNWASGAFAGQLKTDVQFFYHAGGRGSNAGGFNLDASRSSAVYGRASEVRPKSSYQLLCVFLGNEVPMSSSVDLFKRIKHCEDRMDSILDGYSNVQDLVDGIEKELNSKISANTSQINLNTQRIASLEDYVNDTIQDTTTLQGNLTAMQGSIDQLATQISSLSKTIEALSERVTSLEAAQQNIVFSNEDGTLVIDDLND